MLFLILVLWRQRQANLCEFKTNLVYIASSSPVGGWTVRPSLTPPQKKQRKKYKNTMVRHGVRSRYAWVVGGMGNGAIKIRPESKTGQDQRRLYHGGNVALARTWSHWPKLWLSTYTYSSRPVDHGGLQRTESTACLQPSIVAMERGMAMLRASSDLWSISLGSAFTSPSMVNWYSLGRAAMSPHDASL